MQILLNNGANVNLSDENGFSPLYAACHDGHDTTVQLLLNNGADLNLCYNEGCNPLYVANLNGHTSIAQILLNKYAQAILRWKEGFILSTLTHYSFTYLSYIS